MMKDDVDIRKKMETVSSLWDKTEWISCPVCLDDWNKLQQVDYYDPYMKITNMCIRCAETLESFGRLVEIYPFHKPYDNWGSSWFNLIKQYDHNSKDTSYLLKVYSGDNNGELIFDWLLYRSGQTLVLFDNDKKEVVSRYANVMKLIWGINNRIKTWAESLVESNKTKKDVWNWKK